MAYSEYAIQLPRTTSNYGTALKAYVEEIAATIPGITIETVTTETASAYDATLAISVCQYVKLRFYCSSSTWYFRVGVNNAGTASTDYYGTSLRMDNQNHTLRCCKSSGMYFMTVNSNQYSCGKLVSMVNGSEIEVFGYGFSYRVAEENNASYTTDVVVPTITSTQIASLPGNTCFLAEGILSTSSPNAIKAPYLLNGHGPYSVAAASLPTAASIISNGTDYFYMVTANRAFRV